MSQWPQPPPPPPPPDSMFGMGTGDMNDMGEMSNDIGTNGMGANGASALAADNNATQPADPMQDADSMMSMLDNNIIGAFVNDMAMNMDIPDDEMYAQTMQTESLDGTGTFTPTADRMIGNTVEANVPGGDPLPPGAPVQEQSNTTQTSASSNAQADFAKRRDWPAKIVEEMKDFLQILDANGRIKYASRSITELAGYTVDEIRETFLKDLIHPDDQGIFVSDLNESIASGNPLRMFFRLKKKDATYAIFEAVGHAHIAASKFAPNPNNQSAFCQAVFMMARPYPTKNASLLDSFLEHKIENERLQRRIADLRREENAAYNEGSRQMSQDGQSEATPSEATASSASYFYPSGSESSRRARNLNIALTRENLEGAVAARQSDSLRDKMARYEGASHADKIELLTGLRYLEGERSRGITTGNASPALIKGDAGISMPKDRERRAIDKINKKLKTSDEYVCTDCGTLDSPEWRKGPSGPKTLCNACGLRWAKKEKKRNSAMHSNQTAAVGGGGSSMS